ncbi:DNA primase large subunit [Mycena floridula]|nr:DNA primase large subunit [Mycena floridula]
MFSSRELEPKVVKTDLFEPGNSLQYPHKLNFYDRPPLYDVTIEEFETCALDRLRILAEIESCEARNRSWEETKTVTRNQCLKYLRLNSPTEDQDEQEYLRKCDHLGHFVLRLAFCRSDDLRRRFVKAETKLFKMRFEVENNSIERERFLNSRDFNWIAVDSEEKMRYQKQLKTYYHGFKNESDLQDALEADRYYKVKWTRVPDLVDRRKVFLQGGWAYVPSRDQASIVFQEFQVQLEKALELTAKSLPRLDEDTRLMPILNNLSQGFLAGVPADWVASATEGAGDEIKAEMIDEMSRKHFPLCMRTFHENLRKDRHLKHFERLHYGLFLKVLGLSIEEAIAFWRKSFKGGKVQDNQFDKEYKYNIRHSYGLEGRRANYQAKSCQQLLSIENSAHGCPYRHFKPENVQTALLSSYSNQGLSSSDLPEILAIMKTSHFHVACTRVFEITHAAYGVKKGDGIGSFESVTHPNQYAARSIAVQQVESPKETASAMDVDT